MQISVSQKNHVWGVNKYKQIYRRIKKTKKWVRVSGGLKVVSVGGSGVWGISASNKIYHRVGTFGDRDTSGTKVSLTFQTHNTFTYVTHTCGIFTIPQFFP